MSQVTDFQEQESKEHSEGGGGGFSIRLPELSWLERIRKFLHDVRMEMRKTTWPSGAQVWSTTVVVVIAVIFFGTYLWGCDTLFGQFFNYLEKAVR